MMGEVEEVRDKRRVHQIITCPFFEGREYDEVNHMGFAAESAVGEVLKILSHPYHEISAVVRYAIAQLLSRYRV
jgi:hypothetical protein